MGGVVLRAAVVVAALAVRLLVLPAPGFTTDVSTFMAWADRLAAVGPWAFYEPGYFADYPPAALYLLWVVGSLFHGEGLRLAVKALSIPFDLAIAALAASLARRWGGSGRIAEALWLLSPAAIIAGPLWGQVDSIGTFVLFAALAAAGRRRWTTAGALAGVAALVKPQLGVGLLVLAAVVIRDLLRKDRSSWRAAPAAAVAIVALGIPFRSSPLDLLALVRDAASTYPYTSLFAFNVWSLVSDFWVPDDPYVVAGGALLAAGLVGSAAVALRRRGPDAFLIAGALATMAFYFLPTRAHERYLFPALVLLLPVISARRDLLASYLVLSLSFATTLVFALTRYPDNRTTAPEWLEATLFTRGGQLLIAVVMLGSAAFLAVRLARAAEIAERAEPVPAAPPALDVPEPAVRSPEPAVRPPRPVPAGLGPGRAPSRRDLGLAALIALAMLVTRGYRLDEPRDMYFDEVYHARTAFELLAQREPYEWTHPHLAKELMALAIPVFGGDGVVGVEPVPREGAITAVTVANDGTRAYGLADGSVLLRPRGGAVVKQIARLAAPARALVVDGSRVLGATDTTLFEGDRDGGALRTRSFAGPLTSFATAGGRLVVATVDRVLLFTTLDGDPVSITGGAIAVTSKPDGAELYALDALGSVRVLDPATGAVFRTLSAGGPARALAYAVGPNRLFIARTDTPALAVIDLEGGGADTVSLANSRTGAFQSGATALSVVPRTQFLYALADGRVVVVETHGASPYASIEATGTALAVDGEADRLLIVGAEDASLVDTGRHALAWRIPGVVAGAALAFFLVLLSGRLFASRALPLLVGAVVLLDGSMFAQPRIAMNDVYTALFIVAGWYFVVAAHAPRRARRLDLIIAGVCFGLAFAAKWAGAYALAGVFVASLVTTAADFAERRADRPLDLLAGAGRNAAFLFLAFAVIPGAIYVGAYVRWFGGPTIPYGWDLVELTKQMYQYHSGLTSPHPAGSPWWSWPLVLKPVYWYYGQSGSGQNAYLYDAGNLALYWSALGATLWCAWTAVRTRSVRIGFVVFALLTQYVAWIPITRVLFFYHFFTALPFYLLALAVVLAVLWERGERAPVFATIGLATFVAIYFYPFVSGLPVDGGTASMYFVLPTWQYDCQFYPSSGSGFQCDLGGGSVDVAALLARIAFAGGLAAVIVAGATLLPRARARLRR